MASQDHSMRALDCHNGPWTDLALFVFRPKACPVPSSKEQRGSDQRGFDTAVERCECCGCAATSDGPRIEPSEHVSRGALDLLQGL